MTDNNNTDSLYLDNIAIILDFFSQPISLTKLNNKPLVD